MATANVTGGSTLNNVLSLAQLLGGSSGTTRTVTKTVSEDAINAAIRKQLESAQGLAAITGGEKTAGLYNSTVSQQLVNDLLSRTAGEAASQSATTTETTSGGGMSTGTMLGSLGLLALTDENFRKSAKTGITSLADVLSGLGSSSPAASLVGESLLSGSPMASTLDAVSAIWDYATPVSEAVSTGASAASGLWDWASSFWR